MTTLRREALCLGAYAALTTLGTYPLVRSAGSAIPGGEDAWQFYWNLWWVKRAIVDLHASPFFTPDLFFPYGASLYFDTLNFLPSVVVLPFAGTLGLAAAYNVIAFAGFTLSGYGMYRLAWYVLSHEIDPAGVLAQPRAARLAAFLAGVVFTFSSYHFVHLLGHLDLVSTQWLPLAVLFLLKASRERGWRSPVVCAALLMAAALTSYYYLVFLIVFVGLLLAEIATRPREDSRPAARRIAVALLLFGLLASPLIVPMLARGRTEGRTPDPAYDVDRFSTDLLAFVVPSPLHPLLRSAVAPFYRAIVRHDSGVEGVAFLGWAPVLLAIVGVKTHRTTRRFWLVALVLFSLLALGPVIHVAGRPVAPGVSVLMPYRVLALLPYGDIPRVPARFIVMSTLCLSIIAAGGAWRILRARGEAASLVLTALLTAIILVENAATPFARTAVHAPTFYHRLARDPDRAGVIEVPIPEDPAVYPQRMMYQAVHGKPIYGGYVSRSLPPLRFGAIPGFSQLQTLSDTVDDVVSYDAGRLPAISRAALAFYAAGHIVIDKSLMSAAAVERARQIAESLFGASARVFEDPLVLAYAVPRQDARIPAAIWLDTGWSYLERVEERDSAGRTSRWRWMGERARLGAVSSEPATVRLRIVARAFERTRRLSISAGDSPVAMLIISPDRHAYETPRFELNAGTRFITLESVDGAESPRSIDPRRLSVAVFGIELITDRQD